LSESDAVRHLFAVRVGADLYEILSREQAANEAVERLAKDGGTDVAVSRVELRPPTAEELVARRANLPPVDLTTLRDDIDEVLDHGLDR
jgi:hypothetical protein